MDIDILYNDIKIYSNKGNDLFLKSNRSLINKLGEALIRLGEYIVDNDLITRGNEGKWYCEPILDGLVIKGLTKVEEKQFIDTFIDEFVPF